MLYVNVDDDDASDPWEGYSNGQRVDDELPADPDGLLVFEKIFWHSAEFLLCKEMCTEDRFDLSIEVFLNAFAKGLAKPLPKTLCDGIMSKDMNKWIQ